LDGCDEFFTAGLSFHFMSLSLIAMPNTALEATPHSRCGLAVKVSGCLTRWVRGASAFVR
jgi:hypothetical protein